MNRMVDDKHSLYPNTFRKKITNSFQNELFLSHSFFEKKLNFYVYQFQTDFIAYLYRNNITSLKMQSKLVKLLDKYLGFLEKISDANLVKDKNKSFVDQLTGDGVKPVLKELFDNLIEFIKLDQLLGFTSKTKKGYALQLFPGTSEYKGGKTDFREAYI